MLNVAISKAPETNAQIKICNLQQFPCRPTSIFQCLLFASVHTPSHLSCSDKKEENGSNIMKQHTFFWQTMQSFQHLGFWDFIIKAGGVLARMTRTAGGTKTFATVLTATEESLPLQIEGSHSFSAGVLCSCLHPGVCKVITCPCESHWCMKTG